MWTSILAGKVISGIESTVYVWGREFMFMSDEKINKQGWVYIKIGPEYGKQTSVALRK